jgi:exodeoxyribonuclease V alpha subunit
MPIRNNPDKGSAGVFNGTVATITGIDPQGRLVTLRTDDSDIAVYDFDELDQLLHAYAISVHRSQGSEYPYVVAPLLTEAGTLMLHRNLLYTMVTRTKKTTSWSGNIAPWRSPSTTPDAAATPPWPDG